MLGTKQVIAGFEKAILGMTIGASVTVKVLCKDAYGPPRKELVIPVKLSEFPDELEPEVGMQLVMRGEDGEQVSVTIAGVSETEIILDANHPLAGEDLTFEIALISIAG